MIKVYIIMKINFAFSFLYRFVVEFQKYFFIIFLFYLFFCSLDITPLFCDSIEFVDRCDSTTAQVDSDSRVLPNHDDDSKFLSLYKTYVDKVRRKFFWIICEEDRGKFASYKEFKKSWNPNIKIRDEIKKDVKADLEGLFRIKRTFAWFWNRRNPKK